MKILRTLFLTCISIIVIDSYAQSEIKLDVPRIVPVSPTAAAMEKYQSYPVDYCTGIPNITVPLYEIIADDITIPVTLTYHASGLKPKEGCGPAGIGWTLNLEPSVSRKINGIADDDWNGHGWFDRGRIDNLVPVENNAKLWYYDEIVNYKRDTQPDQFTYRLINGGGSGYFINSFDPLMTIPRTNDLVEYSGGTINIKDENGIRYMFSGTYEKCGTYTTRWLCSSIWSPRNSSKSMIDFEYQTFSQLLNPGAYYNLDNKLVFNECTSWGNTCKLYVTEQMLNHNIHYEITWPYTPSFQPIEATLEEVKSGFPNITYAPTSRVMKADLQTARLVRVNFMGNKLDVNYKIVGEGLKRNDVLDDIEVTDENGNIIRTIKFYVTPCNRSTSLTKLDSVKIFAPGVETRTYAFRYNNPSAVPSVYTTAVDHWGFCNGPETGEENSTVLGFRKKMDVAEGGNSKTIILTYQGANREPDREWTKVGVLDQITDPHGIKTTFIYGNNYGAFRDHRRYGEGRDYLHLVGGLRIERIVRLDPTTNQRVYKDYKYGLINPEKKGFEEPVWGGGAIKHIVTERDYCSKVVRFYQKEKDGEGLHENLTTYHSMPITNITFNNGSAVLYNVVNEHIRGDRDEMSTNYYYDVEVHKFEDILTWDDTDVSTSVQRFLTNQGESIISQVANKLPNHPESISGDYVDFYAASHQLNGSLIRSESFKNDSLIMSTDYIYQNVWARSISIDFPVKIMSLNPERYNDTNLPLSSIFAIGNYYNYMEDPQTTYYLDPYYKALQKEIAKEYVTINGEQNVITKQKSYNYKFDFNDPKVSLKACKINTINSNGSLVSDSLEYLYGYPGILSLQRHTVNNSWKENRVLFKSGTFNSTHGSCRCTESGISCYRIFIIKFPAAHTFCDFSCEKVIQISFVWDFLHSPTRKSLEIQSPSDIIMTSEVI